MNLRLGLLANDCRKYAGGGIADIKGVGVYFLICQEDDGTDSVYIGEAENVLDRLSQHLRDYQSGKEKYYWNTAVIFVGRDLNKALIRYLENRGAAFRGNFYCCDESIHPHFGSWSAIKAPQPDFHRPECFGKLILNRRIMED